MYLLEDLTARVHEVAVTLPLLDSPVERRRFVTCEIRTDDGVTGFGLTGQFLPFAVREALTRHFLPLLRGRDIRDTEAVHALVATKLNPRAQTGVAAHALAALDVAMWDARGRTAGEPITRMLGGHRAEVPVYVTFGFSRYTTVQLVEAARRQVDAGVRCLKMVVGVHPGGWAEDARRVRAVREEIGNDVELAIDANYLFSPLDAYLLARELADARIAWFEEPLHTNDVRALADLRRRIAMPVAAGQMEGHRWRLREFVQAQAVDLLQPNVCYAGGYTEARKVAHLAQAYNLPIANAGGWPHLNMHLQAAMMNGTRVELHVGMTQVGERIFPDAPRASGNTIRVPAAPGLGLTPDLDFLAATVVAA